MRTHASETEAEVEFMALIWAETINALQPLRTLWDNRIPAGELSEQAARFAVVQKFQVPRFSTALFLPLLYARSQTIASWSFRQPETAC